MIARLFGRLPFGMQFTLGAAGVIAGLWLLLASGRW
jgi:hypothetical protein